MMMVEIVVCPFCGVTYFYISMVLNLILGRLVKVRLVNGWLVKGRLVKGTVRQRTIDQTLLQRRNKHETL